MSIDGRKTNNTIWSKKILFSLYKLINISEKIIEIKFTPELPIKILLNKFGISNNNNEIANDI